MKPSSELFNLIKSLSKSEKRFFKLSSSLQSGDKNYLKIFDIIDKQAEYNEAGIKKEFKGERFIKHFPSEKNHLYKLILKSLRAYYSDNSISAELTQEIKNIEILYKKALYKECDKFLRRAKKMAKQHEKFYYWFELIRLEKILLEESYEEGIFNRSLDDLIEEEKEVISRLRNLAEYHVLYSKVNYAFRSEGYVRDPKANQIINEVSENYLIKGKNTALSKRAATICFYTQGFCYLSDNKTDLSFIAFSQVKRILDENPDLRKDLTRRYLRTIYNIIIIHISRSEFRSAFKLIEELRALEDKPGYNSADARVRIFRSTYMAELNIYDKLGEHEKAIEVVQEVVEKMDSFKGKLNKEYLITFYLKFAFIYFGAGEYNKALFWLNKILNDNESSLRQDLYSYARIFNLVVHFELKNYDLIDYLIKSTQRFLIKRKRDYEFEKIFIAYVRKINKYSNSEKLIDVYKEFRQELEQLYKDPENMVMLAYFDYLSWLDSKINQVSFSEAIQNRHI
jgi:tetratricopeptide (TPR) repeat protein